MLKKQKGGGGGVQKLHVGMVCVQLVGVEEGALHAKMSVPQRDIKGASQALLEIQGQTLRPR